MTAAWSWALQRALYSALSAEPAIAGLVGERIVDNPSEALAPSGPAILLGEERILPWGSATERGADHRVTVSVLAPDGGFGVLKTLAAEVCAVVLAPLTLDGGRVVLAGFLSARAHRQGRSALRRVDLSFRVVIEDDA